MSTVSVIIPTIPPRVRDLAECLGSVAEQTRPADAVIVATDVDREGSAVTRNRALFQARTEFVAFLDDDDRALPPHLETLMAHAADADVVYTGCIVVDQYNQRIPMQEEWGRFGLPFDGELLRKKSYLPVTSLVRTSLAHQAGGFEFRYDGVGSYDDWGFYLKLLDAGARFLHVPVTTWLWRHHGANSSGRSDRW